MKKILCILLSLLLVLLNGCSSDTGNIRFGPPALVVCIIRSPIVSPEFLVKRTKIILMKLKTPQVPPLISDCCPITISI